MCRFVPMSAGAHGDQKRASMPLIRKAGVSHLIRCCEPDWGPEGAAGTVTAEPGSPSTP